MTRFPWAMSVALASLGMNAGAHEAHQPSAKKEISREEHPWGREGDPRKAVRTISIDMADTMRFTPSELKVKRGETIKFVLRNTGKLMHEDEDRPAAGARVTPVTNSGRRPTPEKRG